MPTQSMRIWKFCSDCQALFTRKVCSAPRCTELRARRRQFAKAPVIASGACLLWSGRKDRDGYGRVGSTGAHRYAWTLHHGPVPDGLCVCHTCDNPACVNLEHLFLGTHQDNMDDMVRKRRQAMKLPMELAVDVRVMWGSGTYSIRQLADRFGVSKSQIQRIVSGRRRKLAQ